MESVIMAGDDDASHSKDNIESQLWLLMVRLGTVIEVSVTGTSQAVGQIWPGQAGSPA